MDVATLQDRTDHKWNFIFFVLLLSVLLYNTNSKKVDSYFRLVVFELFVFLNKVVF